MNILTGVGYGIVENIFSSSEIDNILKEIEKIELPNQFGVREFLYQNPTVSKLAFNKKMKELIYQISPNCKYSIKSIYFDKPPNSNWIVNWHQDLTINLKEKKETKGFRNWRITPDRVVVQPNIEMLENIFTIRIHLDHCTKSNGALQVIKKSHLKGVVDIKTFSPNNEKPHTCEVPKGGVLVMKPLLLHSSKRTENNQNRRVLHIEFCDYDLPNSLEWKEKVEF